MSSQKIPRNPILAPTTDPGQSFFPVLAFRSSDQYHVINPSEASPPVSPMTQRPTKMRPPLRPRSEASHFFSNTPTDESTAFNSRARLSEVVPGEPPLLEVMRPSEAGLFNATDSRSSSISKRARKFLSGSWSRSVSASAIDAEHQKEAGVGPMKRELSGNMFEMRIRWRKSKSDGQSRTISEDGPFEVPYAKPVQNTLPICQVPPKGKPILSETSSRHDKPALIEPNQKSGFSYRAKRRLGLIQESNDVVREDRRVKTFTGEALERAATMLQELSNKKMTPPSTNTSSSNKSAHSSFNWYTHSKRLIPFYSRMDSSSSSIHNARMGNAPQPSPNLQNTYTGSDSKQYFRVEISNPGGPSYLPSEARRINTPPSPTSMLNKNLPGFFFDYNTPHETTPIPSPDAVDSHPLTSRERKKRGSGIHWYRVKLTVDEAIDEQRLFELNVPEHLPNSPLCPRNPKHRSGGKGVCVYHGRNKIMPVVE
ncbi:accessory factor associated with RNA polymerase II [Lobaria immixta]|nr:accessory factor associated with RNA polymerase II [Lobaria immixta]